MAMKEAGYEIDTVWADHQRWRAENDSAVTTPKPYGEVVTSHYDEQLKSGTSERYATEVKTVFERFGDGREEQPIHRILPRELQNFLDTSKDPRTGDLWSVSTKSTQKGRFAGLWSYAIRNGWGLKNITEQLSRLKRNPYDVHVYPNEITMNLMAGILYYEPARERILASTALGLFGCMRPEEIESKKARRNNKPGEPPFGWDCINLKDAGTVNKNAKYAGTAKLERWMTKTIDKRVIR
jgi:hypothetical protein